MKVSEEEVIWLHPLYAPCFMGEGNLSEVFKVQCRLIFFSKCFFLTLAQTPSGGGAIREYFTKAFKAPLLPTHMQQVLSELQADR